MINSQALKMISQVKSFPYPDKQGTPEDQRIQWLKCCVTTNNNKDEDNSLKNTQNVCFYHNLSINITDFIDLMSRVFANGPGDQGSIPGRVIPKTQKNGT